MPINLRVCEVHTGAATVQIVCGAPNARVGLKAPLAQVGGTTGKLKIKKAKLRGLESQGMLCAQAELRYLMKTPDSWNFLGMRQ